MSVRTTRTMDELGAQQRAIMKFVWSQGTAPVRDVLRHLSPDGSLAYTSILSAMQKLEKLGWLRHERRGRAYVYVPALSLRDARLAALESFAERVFEGDRDELVREVRGEAPRPAVLVMSLRDLVDAKKFAA